VRTSYKNFRDGTSVLPYLSASTATSISRRVFIYKMAAKVSRHRYGTKLRHCQPMYPRLRCSCVVQVVVGDCVRRGSSSAPIWRSLARRLWAAAVRAGARTARNRPVTSPAARRHRPATAMARSHSAASLDRQQTKATVIYIFIHRSGRRKHASKQTND